MRRFIVWSLGLLAVAESAMVPDGETWMKQMENGGVMPELTIEQQMHLVGAKMEMSTVPPTTPWWQTVEEGRLPPISTHVKQHLFGENIVMTPAQSGEDNEDKSEITEGE